MITYSALASWKGHLCAAVDVETSGLSACENEIIQIAVQPLDANFRPFIPPFYSDIKPNYFDRVERKALALSHITMERLRAAPSQEHVADRLLEWFDTLELPLYRLIIPLSHNWSFEAGFLKSWLGVETCSKIFHPHVRDSMRLATALNDRAAFRGEQIPFPDLKLVSLCKQLGIVGQGYHDALVDAMAAAKVYQLLMEYKL